MELPFLPYDNTGVESPFLPSDNVYPFVPNPIPLLKWLKCSLWKSMTKDWQRQCHPGPNSSLCQMHDIAAAGLTDEKGYQKSDLLVACDFERQCSYHLAWPHGPDRFAHRHIHVRPEVEVDGITQVGHGAKTLKVKHTTADDTCRRKRGLLKVKSVFFNPHIMNLLLWEHDCP